MIKNENDWSQRDIINKYKSQNKITHTFRWINWVGDLNIKYVTQVKSCTNQILWGIRLKMNYHIYDSKIINKYDSIIDVIYFNTKYMASA